MNRLMIITLLVMAHFVSACSTSRCKRGEETPSAAAASAGLVPAAGRSPASRCQLMLPFVHKVLGRLGNNRIGDDEALQKLLKDKGYNLLDPAGYTGGVAVYLDKIPVGSYGLIVDSSSSFASSGWASALFVLRTPESYEIFKVLKAESGGKESILTMLNQLPNCN